MAIPSVNMFSQQPGGGMVTAMGGINALSNAMLDTEINKIKAQYAPLTAQADAASKLAYANLMGPQFLAKLMGNPDVVANSAQLQDPATVARLYQAGMGGGSGNALMQIPGGGQQPSAQSNPLSWVADKLHGILGGGNQAPAPSSVNAFVQTQPQMQPQPNAPGVYRGQGADSGTLYDSKGNNVIATPQEIEEFMGRAPKTYAEKAGEFAGIKQEGTKSGEIRAKDIDELNTIAFNAQTHQETLDDISSILASPEFEQIRQVPLLGHHELSYYAKEGTPAQQNMVGRYYTDTGNVVKDSARDFAGQFRTGEQKLLMGMKPNASDTVDTARGKVESLSYFNKMLAERSKLTSKIMSQYHVNKLQASEAADKQIDGEKIRKSIHDKLNPTVTIKNRKTGETITVPANEAREKYGVNNNV